MKLSLWNRAVVAELVAKSCQDMEFRKAFLANPLSALYEAGAGSELAGPGAPLVMVHENTCGVLHLILPPMSDDGCQIPFIETPSGLGLVLTGLLRGAAVDLSLRKALVTDPAAVVDARGASLPPGMELRVHEDSESELHIVLPTFPDPSALGVEKLRMVAGGAYVVTFDSSTVGNTIGNYSFVQSASTEYTFLYAGAMQSLQVLLYTGQAVSSTASNASISCYQVAQSLYVQTSVEAEAEVAAVSMAVAALIADAAAEVNVVAVASVVMT